jgi:hypothetical protein
MITRSWTIPAAATAAALVLSGCTGGDDPKPTGSGATSGATSSSSSSSASAPELQDRSAALLEGAATEPTPIATTKAKASSTFKGSTFTFVRLTRTDSSTVLAWQVTGGAGSNPNDANDGFWERYPVLRTKDADYSVVTFQQGTNEWVSVSNPVLKLSAGDKAPLQSAIYPPLPAGTTSVTVRSPWFEDVTVPVS